MDHSVQGYLSRRTTEELAVMLRYCINEEGYRHLIPKIEQLLAERKQCIENIDCNETGFQVQ